MEKLALYIDKIRSSGMGLPFIILAMISLFIMPIPPFLLDVFFTLNIALAIMILINVVQVDKPLDFAAFPTLIMGAAVMRLALNVASTRIILIEGHQGGDSAGQVIESIAQVVIAGDYAVGIIIFAIIMIINLIVINKGAGRVSEVSARFTLDSLPGKQMAIDADLNQGAIDAEEATRRRAETVKEADFYGRMDGSAKFVKGDSVAGILILLINIVGGLFIGTMTHDLSIGDAIETYSLLTIGDGLVAQIPSLIFAVATAVLITRMSESKSLSNQITDQLFSNTHNLMIPGGVLVFLGLFPGMPHVPFLALGGACLYGAYRQTKKKNQPIDDPISPVTIDSQNTKKKFGWDDVELLDDISLKLGSQLIHLASASDSGLLEKLTDIRTSLSKEFGFLIPEVHIRDDLSLQNNEYSVEVQGALDGKFSLALDKLLAVNTGDAELPLQGTTTIEPTLKTEAYWIDRDDKPEAEISGYICVDPTSVIITHIQHVIRKNVEKFIDHESADALVTKLKEKSPRLVEETIPEKISLSELVKILQSLLKEGIPISSLPNIVENVSLLENNPPLNPERLLAAARIASIPPYIDKISNNSSELNIMTLDNNSQNYLLELISNCSKEGISPSLSHEHVMALSSSIKNILSNPDTKETSILVVPSMVRNFISKLLRDIVPDLVVLSSEELPTNKSYQVSAQATLQG